MNITTSYEQAVADLAQHHSKYTGSIALGIATHAWVDSLTSIFKVEHEKALDDLTSQINKLNKK